MSSYTPNKTSIKIIIIALISSLSLTAMNTAIKLAQTHVNHDTIVFTRSVLALLIMLPIILRSRPKLSFKTQRYPLHLFRAIVGIGSIYGIVISLETLPISNTTLLFMAYPLFIPITLFLFMKKPLSLSVLGAIVIGFIGVVFALNPSSNGLLQYGALFALGAGLFTAIAVTIVKKLSDTEPASKIVFYFALNAVFITLIPAMLHWQPIPTIAWFELIAVSLFFILYQQCFAYSIKHGEPTLVIALMYSAIIFSAIIDWILNGKIIHFSTIIGFLLIVVSVVLVALFERQQLKKKQ